MDNGPSVGSIHALSGWILDFSLVQEFVCRRKHGGVMTMNESEANIGSGLDWLDSARTDDTAARARPPYCKVQHSAPVQ